LITFFLPSVLLLGMSILFSWMNMVLVKNYWNDLGEGVISLFLKSTTLLCVVFLSMSFLFWAGCPQLPDFLAPKGICQDGSFDGGLILIDFIIVLIHCVLMSVSVKWDIYKIRQQ